MLVWDRVEARARRPALSFYRLALFSAFLFFPIVVGTWMSGGSLPLAAFMWVAMTMLATIWVVHYERTEPLG
jgi:hypothetical protein